MTQAIVLAAVQDALAVKYPDRSVEITGQAHYIRPEGIAHIDVYGCDDAVQLLQQIGIRVELVGGHDVYRVSPDYSDPRTLQYYASKLHVGFLPTKVRNAT
ncbi:hypothetical protein ACGYLM_19425 [Sulfitobacter sp. 1A10445]|uniref:hypothetical protein n=1 Tax=unclassified Sulfitobacter TaxID=196795 RepID=UPI003744D36B